MWTKNVYYNPEDHGLTVVGTAELAESNYSFDLVGIWKGEKGYYLATDSGCSCPSPFEDYNGIDDLTGPLTAEEAREEATSLWKGAYAGGYDPHSFEEFMALVV